MELWKLAANLETPVIRAVNEIDFDETEDSPDECLDECLDTDEDEVQKPPLDESHRAKPKILFDDVSFGGSVQSPKKLKFLQLFSKIFIFFVFLENGIF